MNCYDILDEAKSLFLIVTAYSKDSFSNFQIVDSIRPSLCSPKDVYYRIEHNRSVVLHASIFQFQKREDFTRKLSWAELDIRCALNGYDPDFMLIQDEDYRSIALYDYRTHKKLIDYNHMNYRY